MVNEQLADVVVVTTILEADVEGVQYAQSYVHHIDLDINDQDELREWFEYLGRYKAVMHMDKMKGE